MSATPITDKIISDADACPETRIVFLIHRLANQCKQFEEQLNAALICAGVASKERGEWAVERSAMVEQIRQLYVYGIGWKKSEIPAYIAEEARAMLRRLEAEREAKFDCTWPSCECNPPCAQRAERTT